MIELLISRVSAFICENYDIDLTIIKSVFLESKLKFPGRLGIFLKPGTRGIESSRTTKSTSRQV
jgi:hypothetical protein